MKRLFNLRSTRIKYGNRLVLEQNLMETSHVEQVAPLDVQDTLTPLMGVDHK